MGSTLLAIVPLIATPLASFMSKDWHTRWRNSDIIVLRFNIDKES
jgi:hypothetical protein